MSITPGVNSVSSRPGYGTPCGCEDEACKHEDDDRTNALHWDEPLVFQIKDCQLQVRNLRPVDFIISGCDLLIHNSIPGLLFQLVDCHLQVMYVPPPKAFMVVDGELWIYNDVPGLQFRLNGCMLQYMYSPS